MRLDARALTAAALVAASSGAWACGFEDPNSMALQRGALNMVYPQALHVIGALSQARLNGAVAPAPQAEVRDPFALLKTMRMLQQLGKALGGKPHSDTDLAFSLVLIEPMLWTRFSVHDGHFSTTMHVNGPVAGDLVMIATEAAVREIAEHRLTAEHAEQAGLIRIYGAPEKVARLRVTIATEAKFTVD
jgi:hypothetical protein